MIPVVTPAEMAEVDRGAPEPVEVLVDRAGAAVARAALRLLGGAYGRRVVVVAGGGNNGADGRSAAARLAARGALVTVVPPDADRLPPADLVIDAAYGTGLSRAYRPPAPAGGAPAGGGRDDHPRAPAGAAVLAVDIPSGIRGDTGEIPDGGGALVADATVTFAALMPGLLLGAGPAHTGPVALADIGLGRRAADAASAWLVTDADAALLPPRPPEGHKWQTAVGVVAGSPGMTGAPWMLSRAAMRAGAGYARLGIPGVEPGDAGLPPGEAVGVPVPPDRWAGAVERCRAVVVGPGLGRPDEPGPDTPVGRLLVDAGDLPAVVDADGLNALGSFDAVAAVTARRSAPVVLTPHAGEWARLAGAPPGADRIAEVRDAARRSGAVVLLKGSVTVVAAPDGRVLVGGSGSPRLATAGTGDVLSGVIGAFLARGMAPLEAAGLAAHVHGRAAASGPSEGLLAADLPDLVSSWLSAHVEPRPSAAVDVVAERVAARAGGREGRGADRGQGTVTAW